MFGAIRGLKKGVSRSTSCRFSSVVEGAIDERLKLSISEVAAQLRAGKITSLELTKLCLAQIARQNDTTRAYISVLEETALAAAAASDERISRNAALGPLDGVPVSVKDNFCMKDTVSSAGSQILSTFVAPYTATVVSRLQDAGAVVVGKTNMDEFGMGSFGVNSSYGVTRNPLDVERTCGGSSSGAAASVAGYTCFAAIGSDTGGSVRLPAEYTGLTGLKPTYGNLSRYGLITYGSSFDCPGLIARTTEDIKLVYNIVQGEDVLDSTCIFSHNEKTMQQPVISTLRVGVLKQTLIGSLEPEVRHAMQLAVDRLLKQGVSVVEVDMPEISHAIATYYTLVPAEAVSNLSRFDGIRYGPSTYSIDDGEKKKGETNTVTQQVDVNALQALYTANRTNFFGTEVKKRINIGNFVLASERYTSFVTKAMQLRAEISDALLDVLTSSEAPRNENQVDALLLPTSTSMAPKFTKIDEMKQNNDPALYADDLMTVLANLAGIPALAVPINKQSFPVGVQVMGNALSEHTLLA